MKSQLELLRKYSHAHLSNSECVELLEQVEELTKQLQRAHADALREAATIILAGGFDGWHHQPTLNDAANAILAAIDQPQGDVCCEWVYDDNEHAPKWDSECGESWCFIEGGPQENNVRYCQGCGKFIKVNHGDKV